MCRGINEYAYSLATYSTVSPTKVLLCSYFPLAFPNTYLIL